MEAICRNLVYGFGRRMSMAQCQSIQQNIPPSSTGTGINLCRSNISVTNSNDNGYKQKSSSPLASQFGQQRFFSQPQEKFPPKRPENAWILYVRERREQWARENPNSPVTKLSELASREWRKMSESEKKNYVDRASKQLLLYREQMQAYKESLSEGQYDKLLEERRNKRQQSTEDKISRALRKTNIPKRPRTAPNFFIKKTFAGKSGSVANNGAAMRDAYVKFRQMSPEEREPFIRMAENDKRRYLDELKAWYTTVRSTQSDPRLIEEAERIFKRGLNVEGLNQI